MRHPGVELSPGSVLLGVHVSLSDRPHACYLLAVTIQDFCLRPLQMQFLLLFSRQGKLRLQKWFLPLTEREKKKVIRDMTMLVVGRPPRSCNFLQWRDLKIVYRRWEEGFELRESLRLFV